MIEGPFLISKARLPGKSAEIASSLFKGVEEKLQMARRDDHKDAKGTSVTFQKARIII